MQHRIAYHAFDTLALRLLSPSIKLPAGYDRAVGGISALALKDLQYILERTARDEAQIICKSALFSKRHYVTLSPSLDRSAVSIE
jgi:hypothetical protein